jgi:hypothetical protein
VIRAFALGQAVRDTHSANEMRYGGHTETAFFADLNVQDVQQCIDSLTGRGPTASHALDDQEVTAMDLCSEERGPLACPSVGITRLGSN